MSETVLVTIASFVKPVKGRVFAPRSRMRISKAEYDTDQALAKQEGHEPEYTLEEDQHCEGRTIEESAKANADYIADRTAKRKKEAAAVLAAV